MDKIFFSSALYIVVFLWLNPRGFAFKQIFGTKTINFIDNMPTATHLQGLVRKAKDFTPEKVKRFFKVGKGEYGEHDQFLGASMPSIRKIAKENKDVDNNTITQLLKSKYNEERALALVLWTEKFPKSSTQEKKSICDLYLENLKSVNNWNLVDISAHKILGEYLLLSQNPLTTLTPLASSAILWERRVAIVSTWAFIKAQNYTVTMHIADQLLSDSEDLIHKATGWMLREMGKQNQEALLEYLERKVSMMPKTMFNYATERLTAKQQQHFKLLRETSNDDNNNRNEGESSNINH
jgi:3-methyladenine DNA glycosylase AlkD